MFAQIGYKVGTYCTHDLMVHSVRCTKKIHIIAKDVIGLQVGNIMVAQVLNS